MGVEFANNANIELIILSGLGTTRISKAQNEQSTKFVRHLINDEFHEPLDDSWKDPVVCLLVCGLRTGEPCHRCDRWRLQAKADRLFNGLGSLCRTSASGRNQPQS